MVWKNGLCRKTPAISLPHLKYGLIYIFYAYTECQKLRIASSNEYQFGIVIYNTEDKIKIV